MPGWSNVYVGPRWREDHEMRMKHSSIAPTPKGFDGQVILLLDKKCMNVVRKKNLQLNFHSLEHILRQVSDGD